MRRTSSFSLLVLGCAALSACATHSAYQRPDLPIKPAYVDGHALSPAATPSDWWQGFHDAKLSWAIGRALAQNLDIAQVQARLAQARAAAGLTASQLLPSVDLGASAARVQGSLQSPIGEVAHAVGAPRNYSDYSLGAQASWELDVFGGLQDAQHAATAEALATEAFADAMKLSISADVADAYLTLRGLQARMALALDQEQAQGRLVTLIRQRFAEGLSSEQELQRAIAAMEGVKALTPPLRAAMDGQLHRLDVLMGTQPGTHRADLDAPAPLPPTPQPSGSLTPADLLRHRPDVVAAEQRLIAAHARVGSALSEYYPHLSLGAAIGWASLSSSTLLSAEAQQAQGVFGLRWRLFDFGRIDAEVAMAKGKQAEMLAAYRQAMWRATEDVEVALSRLTQRRQEATMLEKHLAALRTVRTQTQQAYQQGLVGLIDVLEVERELLSASDRLVATQADEAKASVSAFRSLGGGWHN